MTPVRVVITAAGILLSVVQVAAAADAQPRRILIEYIAPKNPVHQSLHEHVKEERVLEKLQELFSPFKLPIDLTFKTVGCDGRSNAWYHRPSITLCYEYLHDIRENVPKETTPAGTTPADALAGQLFYVVAHEFGHAVFDLLQLPSFGNSENIADQFSTYMMLHFGKDEARRLISGAAYSYKSVLQSPIAFVPLQAYSDIHGQPGQRLFNLLCLAYGADPKGFADVVEHKYLPTERAADCGREYSQVDFAFQKLISPHVDQELAKRTMQKDWLSEVQPRRSP